jgi:hypothetical protein
MGKHDRERRVYSKEFKAEAVALAEKRPEPEKSAVAASLPLMREYELHVRGMRKFIPTTNSNHEFPVCANLLNRRFRAEGVDRNGCHRTEATLSLT